MLPPPTRLLLVRHGHTAANGSSGRMWMSGWTDTPLSGLGRREAALTARHLAGHAAVAAIYSSPLGRALETAAAVSAALGLPVTRLEGLREIGCGSVDGWEVARVQREHPGLWRRNAEERDETFRWPGGESYRELRARCLRTLRGVARRHPGAPVILVTHAGFISQALGAVLGESCARWSAHRPANASITTLEWGPGRRTVLEFDARVHLPGGRAFAEAPPRPRPHAG